MISVLAPFLCPPLGGSRATAVREAIRAWVESPALARLVEAFGGRVPSDPNLGALVLWLLDFSERWDFRRLQRDGARTAIAEGARWLLSDDQASPEQRAVVEDCAVQLGLAGVGDPSQRDYDYVLVLGGARLSCLLRPRYAAKLMQQSGIRTKAVALLASARPVADSERDATDTYAAGAVTEFDLMNAGGVLAFPLDGDPDRESQEDADHPNSSWAIWRYATSPGAPPVISLCAPSSEPGKRRANSADTYEFFLSRFAVPRGSSLLLVTSQIYVPYQQLEAIRTVALPYELEVETVGFPPDWGGSLQGMVGATNYLQEIRSTIQSASRFLQFSPASRSLGGQAS